MSRFLDEPQNKTFGIDSCLSGKWVGGPGTERRTSYFPAQKSRFLKRQRQNLEARDHPTKRVEFYGRWPGLRSGLVGHRAADVDRIVGDHAEADPALDAGLALIPAAVQPVPSLDHADAALGAGPPLLPVAEPAFPLLAFALEAFGERLGMQMRLTPLAFAAASFFG